MSYLRDFANALLWSKNNDSSGKFNDIIDEDPQD